MTTPDTPETITRAELAAYYERRGDIASPADAANAAFANALAHREPEYEPGEAYTDARGDRYLRSSTGGWVDYSTTWHPHELPKRPLRKLVPEGFLAARLGWADVLATLKSGMDEMESVEQLAARVCKLADASARPAAPEPRSELESRLREQAGRWRGVPSILTMNAAADALERILAEGKPDA